jgi:hypothetical protein
MCFRFAYRRFAKRPDDIPILVEYFVKRFAEKMAKRIRQIEKRTLELCERYAWPGNIRELQNIVERSVILTNGDTFSIDESWLPTQVPGRPDGSSPLPETLHESGEGHDRSGLGEEPGKGGWATRGCCHARNSRLDARIKNQATWDCETQIHSSAMTRPASDQTTVSKTALRAAADGRFGASLQPRRSRGHRVNAEPTQASKCLQSRGLPGCLVQKKTVAFFVTFRDPLLAANRSRIRSLAGTISGTVVGTIGFA